LIFADFDRAVHRILAQPFLLKAKVDRKIRKHVPDYFLVTDRGPVVVDVKPEHLLEKPGVRGQAVEVLPLPAAVDHAVDRGGTAHDLAAGPGLGDTGTGDGPGWIPVGVPVVGLGDEVRQRNPKSAVIRHSLRVPMIGCTWGLSTTLLTRARHTLGRQRHPYRTPASPCR
jgi:hypothetical protein